MTKTIGFIGLGNMGQAILKGMLINGFTTANQVIVSRRHPEALVQIEEKFGVETTTDNRVVAKQADLLILAVKPNIYASIMQEIRDYVKDDVIIVHIAAGISIATIETAFARPIKVARAMPNTPAMVGQAMTGLCFNDALNAEDKKVVANLFASLGKVEIIDETLIDAVIGVSGSSPAILYMVIEAMADGAVKAGMPRQQAYQFAAQAMLGSAKMVLETGEHPGQLKDAVCSPGGTTIEMVTKAEEKGLRASILASVDAAITKSIQLTQK